ncbi:unnamed protein product [Cuscuta europaea]|uniref:Uncharacterized protein n=1 Tax=Cuscuta europaea TaxID=41803 RepID=A0A9P1EJA2_CUSEU|nr:unnamed protein product [Cuscuta europaea]
MSSGKGSKNPSGSGASGHVPQGDAWETYGKKSRNKAGSSATNQRAPQNSTAVSTGNAWGTSGPNAWNHGGSGRGPASDLDPRRPPAGRGNDRVPAVITPPLQHGWNWSSRVAPTQSASQVHQIPPAPESIQTVNDEMGEEDTEDDDMLDDSDEELLSDDFDSDGSAKSHGTRKKNPWFKEFFDSTDKLANEELNDPERQWHCPACKGGPGAIDWYKGLLPLMTHAKTRRSKRTKLHREFAELLEEELNLRGTSVSRAGESYGSWNGIIEKDYEIVWPPMVIIMNTRLEKDDKDKWTGMGNQELLDYFHNYAAVRARHSYGPQGHRGMSVLIFEASAVGYLEAERLGKHFSDTGRDRESWVRNPVLFYAGGRRQLYGYMAGKKDIDSFNQHSHGKTQLKFEMRSHREMVVNPMKQMSEDNQQLQWYKNKAAKHQKQAKALEESFLVMGEKCRETAEQNKVVLSRTKTHHEQNQEEMKYLDWFIKEKLQSIHDANTAWGGNHASSSVADNNRRAEQLAKYFESLELEKGDSVEHKQKLMEAYEELKCRRQAEEDEMKRRHQAEEDEMRRRHQEEEAAAKEGLNAVLAKLMEK